MLRTLACLSIILGLLAAPRAQQIEVDELIQLVPHGTPVLGDLRRVVLGDYLDQRRIHAIVVDGNQAFLQFSPGVHSSATALDAAWVVNDVATLRARPGDRADRILGVGPAGLTVAGFLAAPAPASPQTFHWSVAATGNWVGANRVLAAGNAWDGAAIGRTGGNRLLVQHFTAGQVGVAHERQFQQAIHDLAVVEWDQVPGPEVAVLVGNNLRVYSFDLSTLLTSIPGSGSGRLAVLDSQPGARVAWVRRETSGIKVHVCNQGGVLASQALPASLATAPGQSTLVDVYDLAAAAAADANGDGLADLAIVQNSSAEVLLFLQLAQSSFGGSTEFSLTATPWIPTDLRCAPAFEDFDRDRAADMLVPRSGTDASLITIRRIAHALGSGGSSVDGTPLLLDAEANVSAAPYNIVSLDIGIEVPVEFVEVPGEYRLQVVLWRQPGPSAPGGSDLDPVAVGNQVYPLTPHPQAIGPGHVQVTVPLPGDYVAPYWSDARKLWAEVRLVAAAGNVADAVAEASLLIGFCLAEPGPFPTTIDPNGYMAPILDLASGPMIPVFGRRLLGACASTRKLPATGGGLPVPGPILD